MKVETLSRIVTEENARVFSGKYLVNLPIRNPVCVMDVEGKVVGAATLSFVGNALQVEMHVAKGTPEAFDLEVNPERVEMSMNGLVNDEDGLDVSITLNRR